jgi:uncharacterized protein (TIGR00730 family)
MSITPRALKSICVYCGSSGAAKPPWLAAANDLGRILGEAGLRLVYGGGGFGLMGACARGAKAAGGEVLGIIPQFLISAERPLEGVETVVVTSMHERKIRMFEEADGFVVLPGAIGTLEEAIELLSWRRLGLHAKPIVFYNPEDFWAPLFALFQSFIDQHLCPPEFALCWSAVDRVEAILDALAAAPAEVQVAHYVAARS